MFGQIYEYFLANFALSEGQGGGEFFTPRSVVKLMTEIIEPHGGKVYDPACGSGGMFVQSAEFIQQHQADKAADLDVFVCGTEKTLETVKLAKMNLAVNNLRGDIKQANTYYEGLWNPAQGRDSSSLASAWACLLHCLFIQISISHERNPPHRRVPSL